MPRFVSSSAVIPPVIPFPDPQKRNEARILIAAAAVIIRESGGAGQSWEAGGKRKKKKGIRVVYVHPVTQL